MKYKKVLILLLLVRNQLINETFQWLPTRSTRRLKIRFLNWGYFYNEHKKGTFFQYFPKLCFFRRYFGKFFIIIHSGICPIIKLGTTAVNKLQTACKLVRARCLNCVFFSGRAKHSLQTRKFNARPQRKLA